MRGVVMGIGLATALAGCASNSANMRVGTDMTYASLKEQREASQTVQVLANAPAGAVQLGKVDAARCHRNTLQAEPTEAELLLDLKVAAYARGADGITSVQVTKSSGLMQNCWSIINGTAQAFQIKR